MKTKSMVHTKLTIDNFCIDMFDLITESGESSFSVVITHIDKSRREDSIVIGPEKTLQWNLLKDIARGIIAFNPNFVSDLKGE